jgi:hypothetical protein
MKNLILKRIEEIKKLENGFSRSIMKWDRPLSHGTENKYANEIKFEELNDTDLLFLFERILRKHYSQH